MLFDADAEKGNADQAEMFMPFRDRLFAALEVAAADPEVVGFKSIVCYRTGLNITVEPAVAAVAENLSMLASLYRTTRKLRLQTKLINDFVVNTVLQIAGRCGKPGQFRVGSFACGTDASKQCNFTPGLVIAT